MRLLWLPIKSDAVTATVRTRFTTPSDLVCALDGEQVRLAGERWQIEIYGVCDQGEHRWVQLALTGPVRYMLTLKLAAGDGAHRAVMALGRWLTRPSETAGILSVG